MPDRSAGDGLSPHRWYALAVLGTTYTIWNVDRNLVVILAEPIRREFGLSDTQLGLLTGTSFAIAFAAAGIPLGFLVDRANRVKLISRLLAIWSIVTMLCGFARTFPVLILTRVAVGAAESGAAPTCLSILSDYFPKSRRGTAIGLFYLATPIGLAIGFGIGGVLAEHLGWRQVFLLGGAPGVAFALLVWLTVREPVRGAFEASRAGPSLVSSWGSVAATLREKKTLLLLILAAVSVIIGQSGVSAFRPSLFVRHHGLPLDQVGLYIALIMGVGGALGMPFGGMLADFVSKRSLAFAPRAVGIVVLLATPFEIAGCLAPTIEWSVGFFFVYSVLVHAYLGPTLSTFLTLSPPALRGAMSAFLVVAMNLIGYGVGPQLTGIISDGLAAMNVAESLRLAMVATAGFLVLSGALYLLASLTTTRDAADLEAAVQEPARPRAQARFG